MSDMVAPEHAAVMPSLRSSGIARVVGRAWHADACPGGPCLDQTGSFDASVGPVGTQPADGLAADIADRFEQRDETLRLALDAARLGVWDYDMQAGSCLLSATAAGLLGRPAARMQGRLADWLARVHPADRERLALAFDAALRDGADFEAEYRTLPVVDGGLPAPPRWLHSHGRVLRDAGGRPRAWSGSAGTSPRGTSGPPSWRGARRASGPWRRPSRACCSWRTRRG